MSSIVGGPTVTKTPAPTPLFPGVNKQYTDLLTNSGIGAASFGALTDAAKTGLPSDVGPAFEAMKASMKNTVDEGATNLREQFGVAGLSTGSDIMKAGSDYESKASADMNATLSQYQLAASEAAANRKVAAGTTGAGMLADAGGAFRQTGVVSQQSGILGGVLSLLTTLFPGLDLGAGSGAAALGG